MAERIEAVLAGDGTVLIHSSEGVATLTQDAWEDLLRQAKAGELNWTLRGQDPGAAP